MLYFLPYQVIEINSNAWNAAFEEDGLPSCKLDTAFFFFLNMKYKLLVFLKSFKLTILIFQDAWKYGW